jgi:hypothetical protein
MPEQKIVRGYVLAQVLWKGFLVLVGRTDDRFVGANIANMSAPAKQDYPNKASYTPLNEHKNHLHSIDYIEYLIS